MKATRTLGAFLCAVVWIGCGDDSSSGNNNVNNQNAAVCGNGVVDEGEQCDNGEENSSTEPDACREDCRDPTCGDGVKDSNEDCDDGDDGHNRSDDCPNTCLAPVCGDGHVWAGHEVCDDGNTDDGDDCRGDCGQDMTVCGDGNLDPGEQCDDGEVSNSDTQPNACRSDCQNPVCGDGVADDDFGEDCDASDLGGATCESLNLDGGTLTCDASCVFVRTGCFGCGNDVCEWSLGETDQAGQPGYCAADCVETACGDQQDNDDDGDTDCADADCDGETCGAHGRVCDHSTLSCVCTGNGGTPETAESNCGDGYDNDCDGLVDCDDPDCDGDTCGGTGYSGMVCQYSTTSCVCSGNGGTPETTETTCNDGYDNDCDGVTDCADSDCEGKYCIGTTHVCTAEGICIPIVESNCEDGSDDDYDGYIDCEDSDCLGQPCDSNNPSYTCQTNTSPPPTVVCAP